jgi:hypothetical protein
MKEGEPSNGQSWKDIHTVMSSGKMNMVKVKRTAGKTNRKPLMARRRPSELGPPARGGEGAVVGVGAVMLVIQGNPCA